MALCGDAEPETELREGGDMSDQHVDVYRSGDEYHFVVYTPGVKGGRKQPTICGRRPEWLDQAAWFKLGDKRGRVHYDRACDECRAGLVI